MVKGQRTLRRRSRSSRGFTLLELMVVIMLVAILAMIAAPSMSVARNDRLAFDYARQTSELLHNARARAAGRGAAHLSLFTVAPSFGTRGAVYVFEALDGVAPPTGPNPSTRCRSTTQWADVASYTPSSARATSTMRLIDFFDVNRTNANSTQAIEDIRMIAHVTDTTTAPVTPHVSGTAITVVAVCVTPNGSTFVGTGTNAANAIAAMADSTETYKGTFEIDVTRNRGGTPVGLIRRVIVSGAAAPRIRSE